MSRFSCWLLVVASVGCWGQSASAQAIVRPREFSLIRPTFPPPKPNVMAPINIKPIKQLPFTSTNNNPRPTVFPSLRLTAVVPQGMRRQNSGFAVQLYQPRAWAGANAMTPPVAATSATTIAAGSSSEAAGGGRRPSLGW